MRYLIAAGIIMIGAVIPLLLSTYASADALADRQIQLSSAAAGATSVTYNVKFTPTTAAGAVVIDFCSNSPVIGDTCTDPTADGFSVTSAASTTTNFTDVTGTGHQIVIAGTMAAGTPVAVVVTGITNPTTAGPLYARMVTYDTKADAANYVTTNDATQDTGYADQGGVALTILNNVNVSGRVLETMTFCVAGEDTSNAGVTSIAATCAPAFGNLNLPAPTLKLGEGNPKALSASAVSTGDIYTQISTNASSGAVVYLKGGKAGCGGLTRAGALGACDIKPATAGITSGNALFGVKTSAPFATADYTNAMGTLEPAGGSVYNNTNFTLGYVSGDATGTTSTYGDPFLDTSGGPIDNQNMKLTFGASISNNTPAGTYSTDLSLIAVGKF